MLEWDHLYLVRWDCYQEKFATEQEAARRYNQVKLLDKQAQIIKVW
jgi:hypothetical protein